jgi:hypothetical protein
MAVTLNVPFVAQPGPGAHRPAANPRDEAAGCWYACACMVAHYFRSGPGVGLQDVHARNLADGLLGHQATSSGPSNPVSANDHAFLAQREQLGAVARCATPHHYTLIELEDRLRSRGPIFYYWMKLDGAGLHGHASVMIGVDDTGIIYHDPRNAPSCRMPIGQFNGSRQRWRYALMQRW